MLKIFRINQTDFEHWTGVTTGEARLGWRVIYVRSIERLPICIMKCYKSVQNVDSNGNIEMMYSSAQSSASPSTTAHESEKRREKPTLVTGDQRKEVAEDYLFLFLFRR